MQSLWTSLSAMHAGQMWLDRTAENIANVDTPGYAALEGSFADALTAALQGTATASSVPNRDTPPGWRGGTGVVGTRETRSFESNPVIQTGRSTDLAPQGDVFFAVLADGEVRLTKAGNFQWSQRADGRFELTTPAGDPVLDVNGQPILRTGSANAEMTVASDGTVRFAGQRGSMQRIALVRVELPEENLMSAGDNTYRLVSGSAIVVNRQALPDGVGVQQGALLQSNVDMTQAMTDLIRAQRLFDLNAEALQLTNRMMETANQIRTG
jgi:flagellar basal-body rod protein FlgG